MPDYSLPRRHMTLVVPLHLHQLYCVFCNAVIDIPPRRKEQDLECPTFAKPLGPEAGT
jgi:hypothetical protein